MNRTQIHLVDEEVDFPSNEQLVSTTDLQGSLLMPMITSAGLRDTAGPR